MALSVCAFIPPPILEIVLSPKSPLLGLFPKTLAAQFFCNYHIGKKIVVSRSGLGCYPYEWYRAWKWGEGIEFTSHEPPILNHQPIRIPRGITEEMGMVFDHYAYSTKSQVEFKEDFYGYTGLLKSWEELQKSHGPARLNRYFSHIQDRSVVDDAT